MQCVHLIHVLHIAYIVNMSYILYKRIEHVVCCIRVLYCEPYMKQKLTFSDIDYTKKKTDEASDDDEGARLFSQAERYLDNSVYFPL